MRVRWYLMTEEEAKRKVVRLKNNLFYLQMKDHWTMADYEQADEYRDEIRNLEKMIEEVDNE
jgi:protein-arginine kinase activator protein McsA